ncbi:MAG: PKD domain-containing protein [Sphingobacteriales bacterium]|nr:PKD domain-containing protein [Sphingobacteriales bacterium]
MNKIILFLFLLLNDYLAAQENPEGGLIARYPFDGNFNDATGNNNNGKQNAVQFTSDRTGKSNSACYFNGASSYIELPYSPLFNFSPKSDFSISLWVSPDQGNSWPAQALIVKSPYHHDFNQSIWTYGIYLYNYRAMSGYAYTHLLNSYTSFTSSSCWYHITVTYSRGNWRMYINGKEESGSGNEPDLIGNDSRARLVIGKKGASRGDWFKGKLDEIRIYNRVLTPEEIKSLSANPCPPTDCSSRIPARFDYTLSSCFKAAFKLQAKKSRQLVAVKWDFGDGKTGTGTNPVHLFPGYGTYKVTAVASSKPACKDTFTRTLTIKPVNAAFSFSEQGQPGKIAFKAQQNGSASVWDFGDGEKIKNEPVVVHQYTGSGDYTATLYATGVTGCRDSLQKNIAVVLPEKILAAQSAAPDPAHAAATQQAPLEKREKEIIKKIVVEQDSVSISLYDNGIIDGDSITLLLDDQVLLTRQLLARVPLQLHIPISREKASHELTMYAENLGSIPPNTALLIIHDGEKRYEVYISSNKKSNGVILFTRNP